MSVQSHGEGQGMLCKGGEGSVRYAACFCLGDKLTSLEATSGVAPASKNLEVSFV